MTLASLAATKPDWSETVTGDGDNHAVSVRGVLVRRGKPSDVRGLVQMHGDCSADSVKRRFLTPMPVLSTQVASQLLVPQDGFSLLAEKDNALAGIATVARADTNTAEVGILVADRFHRQGIGTALLVASARECALEGYAQILMTLHPDNYSVVAVVSSAGLRARVSTRDGVTYIYASLAGLRRGQPASV